MAFEIGIGINNTISKMKTKKQTSIYKQAQRFADVTKQYIATGNISRAKHCLAVAAKLMENGNTEMKNAICNVYVFSVSGFLEIHHCAIRNLFPEKLLTEYHKQVNTS
ncbi:MAG: hypothetical protein LC111_12280 [Bacteroidia bacterium]|nr:hypothetical protein [Bacteroidia bacterium]